MFGYICAICNGTNISVAWFGPTLRIHTTEQGFRTEKLSDKIKTSCYCNDCGYKWEEEDAS